MPDRKKVMLVAGGTGGHILPARCLAEAALKSDLSPILALAGASACADFDRDLPCPVVSVGLARPRRPRGRFAAVLAARVWEMLNLLARTRPDALVLFGGYPTLPALLAAVCLRKRVYLVEPNALPGKVNRFADRFARRVFIHFEEVEALLSSPTELTGVPIRPLPPPEAAGPYPQPYILFMGGSQGARSIVEKAFYARQLRPSSRFHFVLVAGRRDDYARALLRRFQPPNFTVEAYLADPLQAMRSAALIVSRSGASSLAEICALGRPGLLVPYPLATDNHQFENAQALARRGAACLVEDSTSKEAFSECLYTLLAAPDQLAEMGGNALKLGKPQAAFRIAACLHRDLAEAGAS